jgi:hypothetical protein
MSSGVVDREAFTAASKRFCATRMTTTRRNPYFVANMASVAGMGSPGAACPLSSTSALAWR